MKWFGPKKWGYGWRPVSWQGWAVMGVFVLAMVLNSAYYQRELSDGNVYNYITMTVILVLLLIWTAKKTS